MRNTEIDDMKTTSQGESFNVRKIFNYQGQF